jgi:GNAT superfamily N-acetyltransferase
MLIRHATREDLPAIVAMLADDDVNAGKECFADPLPASYYEAFERIEADPSNELFVAENDAGEVAGTFQVTWIPHLLNRGSLRAHVEMVWVRHDQRKSGIGEAMMRYAIAKARERGAFMVQLTSNRKRADAHRFYERLGFEPTHTGFKLFLQKP